MTSISNCSVGAARGGGLHRRHMAPQHVSGPLAALQTAVARPARRSLPGIRRRKGGERQFNRALIGAARSPRYARLHSFEGLRRAGRYLRDPRQVHRRRRSPGCLPCGRYTKAGSRSLPGFRADREGSTISCCTSTAICDSSTRTVFEQIGDLLLPARSCVRRYLNYTAGKITVQGLAGIR